MKKAYGFTIVELLIVIVVIAILATISIVAYNGIQDRTNDSVVKSDLANFAKKVGMIQAETGQYPEGTMRYASASSYSGSLTSFPASLRDFKPTRDSYTQIPSGGSPNFVYCVGARTDNGQPGFQVAARSISGKLISYSSAAGLGEKSVALTISNICSDFSYPRSASYGYLNSSWFIGN